MDMVSLDLSDINYLAKASLFIRPKRFGRTIVIQPCVPLPLLERAKVTSHACLQSWEGASVRVAKSQEAVTIGMPGSHTTTFR